MQLNIQHSSIHTHTHAGSYYCLYWCSQHWCYLPNEYRKHRQFNPLTSGFSVYSGRGGNEIKVAEEACSLESIHQSIILLCEKRYLLMQVEVGLPSLFSRLWCRKTKTSKNYIPMTSVFSFSKNTILRLKKGTGDLQRWASLAVCTLPVLLTPPRFHRAHLKHIRLLERCQAPAMREKPVYF